MYDFDLALESDLETVWNSAFLNKEFRVSWKSLKMCCQKRFLKVITVSLMVNKEYCPILSRIMFVPLLRYRPLWRKWLISLFYMQIMLQTYSGVQVTLSRNSHFFSIASLLHGIKGNDMSGQTFATDLGLISCQKFHRKWIGDDYAWVWASCKYTTLNFPPA